MSSIIDQIHTASNGWPCRVNNTPFIDDPKHGLSQFAKDAELFGWMHSFAGVYWLRSPATVSRAELFAELSRTAKAYLAIESYPHFPPLAKHYYSHPTITPGKGSAQVLPEPVLVAPALCAG